MKTKKENRERLRQEYANYDCLIKDARKYTKIDFDKMMDICIKQIDLLKWVLE